MKNTGIQAVLLESSNLTQVDYDSMMQTMTVGFVNGTVYEYYGVPEEVFQQLTKANSAGKFFLANIRSKFDFAKRGKLTNLSDEDE